MWVTCSPIFRTDKQSHCNLKRLHFLRSSYQSNQRKILIKPFLGTVLELVLNNYKNEERNSLFTLYLNTETSPVCRFTSQTSQKKGKGQSGANVPENLLSYVKILGSGPLPRRQSTLLWNLYHGDKHHLCCDLYFQQQHRKVVSQMYWTAICGYPNRFCFVGKKA